MALRKEKERELTQKSQEVGWKNRTNMEGGCNSVNGEEESKNDVG